jgi:hypothetical protein
LGAEMVDVGQRRFPELPHGCVPSFGFAGGSRPQFYGKRSSGTGRRAAEPARPRHSAWNENCDSCILRDWIDFSVRVAPAGRLSAARLVGFVVAGFNRGRSIAGLRHLSECGR